jgi:TPR repeat protein
MRPATDDVQAMHDLAYRLEHADPPDLTQARRWYERAASSGHPGSMHDLGRLAERQDPPDRAAARDWYERAAATGHIRAMYDLGRLLADRTDPPDLTVALRWYEKAAAAGSTAAIYELGELHRTRLTPADLDAARRWHERGAAAGDADCAFVAGWMYENDSDSETALAWYERAALGGNASAMNNLANLLAKKPDDPNVPAALAWYERAVASGSTKAAAGLARLRGTQAPPPAPVSRRVSPSVLRSAPPSQPAPRVRTGITAALDAMAENPYQYNAFRLAGLRTDADSRRLRQRVTEWEAAERLGAPLPHASALPVTPLPDPAEVKSALNRLREPVQRLVQELFWLWPDAADTSNGLTTTELPFAERIWLARVADDPTAAHNLAVVLHIRALETPESGSPESWLDALTAWDAALGDPALWQRLRERADAIDGRRLDEPTLAELRSTLPRVLLRPQSTLIVRAARDGDAASAEVHAAVLDQLTDQATWCPSVFDVTSLSGVRDAAVGALATYLKTLADETSRTASEHPAQASVAAHRLLDRASVPLRTIDLLRPRTDPIAAGAHDSIVRTVFDCDIAQFNEKKEAAASIALLERLAPIVTTDWARDRLTTEWTAVLHAQLSTMCDRAREITDANGHDAAWAARDLLDHSRLALARLRTIHGATGEPVTKPQDAIAAIAVGCTVVYCNSTGDLDGTEKLLSDIRPLPVEKVTREFLERQTETVRGLLRRRAEAQHAQAQAERVRAETEHLWGTCWFCGKRPAAHGQHFPARLHRDVVHSGRAIRWKTHTVNVPRCAQCRAQHKPDDAKKGLAATVAALSTAAAVISFVLGFGLHGVWLVTAACVVVAALSWGAVSTIDKAVLDRAWSFPPVVERLQAGWRRGERPGRS